MPRRVDPGSIRRVLVVRPRFLGDVCLTLPTLDALREACPGARIAYVVERAAAPLLAGDPRIDTLIVAERRGSPAGILHALWSFAPDLAVDLFCNPRTALWCALSGARVRVGYPGKGWRSRLYTHHARPRTLSAVGFHLAALGALGWPAEVRTPRLHVGAAALDDADRALETLGVPAAALRVGFHPGARWETRRWPPERFAALAERFLARHPTGVALVTGAGDEARTASGIVAALPAGRAHAILDWPLERLVALQRRCAAFVSGDTGPLHASVAAGTPTLALMSRNRPATFFPYPASEGHRAYYARVECSPCDRDRCEDLRCLDRLTVDGAWALLARMLEEAAGRAAPPLC